MRGVAAAAAVVVVVLVVERSGAGWSGAGWSISGAWSAQLHSPDRHPQNFSTPTIDQGEKDAHSSLSSHAGSEASEHYHHYHLGRPFRSCSRHEHHGSAGAALLRDDVEELAPRTAQPRNSRRGPRPPRLAGTWVPSKKNLLLSTVFFFFSTGGCCKWPRWRTGRKLSRGYNTVVVRKIRSAV